MSVNDKQIGYSLFDFFDGLLDDAIFGPGLRAGFVLSGRQAEKQNGRYA